MPANLPPQYFDKEKELKTAKSTQEKIAIMEELLSLIPKHKGTEKLQALFKTKIAKLKSQTQKKPTIARRDSSFHIEKSGAGQVVLIGPPNAGKSMLVKSLTNANPEIGDYPFTTRIPLQAMMKHENIQVQLIDTPPITPDYMEVWHAELIKNAEGLLILLDLSSPNLSADLQMLLEKLFEKKITLVAENQQLLLNSSIIRKRALIVGNKKDLSSAPVDFDSVRNIIDPKFDPIQVSAFSGDNLEELKRRIFSLLHVLRVYSKIPGKKADLNNPFIFKQGSSLMDMTKAVHKDFAQKLKYARIWSRHKYQGQKVNRDYALEDEDIIELHI
ncbi:GTPase [Acidobacteriota bacterium]